MLKELEEHGEPMVQCIQWKAIKPGGNTSTSTTKTTTASKSRGRAGKAKSSCKVTVMKATPQIIPLPFLGEETPAAGTRGARKKKKEEDEPKK